MSLHGTFSLATDTAHAALKDRSTLIHTEKWQGRNIKTKPEMATHELLNYSFQVPIHTEELVELQKDIGPNLPWADDHFEERVGRQPLNPGNQWVNWPYAHSANSFRDEEGQKFSHTYMERYWPIFAEKGEDIGGLMGVRYGYGDLDDLVDLLHREPQTRQAFLPVWFPEDTGVTHGGRVPCTLGYHFIMRGGYIHIVYYIRSCDFVRHFRDDIYLTVRLLLWVLDQLRLKDHTTWGSVSPGLYTMHITSLHLFKNDWGLIDGGKNEIKSRA